MARRAAGFSRRAGFARGGTLAENRPVPPPAEPPFLTDEQLLALFPNTPVALATLPNGRKKLIFPHPGDEQKYVTHL